MIREIHGDLLACDADVLCHQTNYHGVMGGGVALAIADRLLSPEDYSRYQKMCLRKGAALIGSVQYIQSSIEPRYTIANLFSQDERLICATGTATDYNALEKCLVFVEHYAYSTNKTVAVPGGIGCGVAGGDWTRVRQIIERVFGDNTDVQLTIVYKD